jgi:hypothetical protein
MSKRRISLILALLLIPALCACGQESNAPAESPVAAETPAPAETPAAAETPAPAESAEPLPEDPDARPALPDAGLHPAQEKPGEDPEIAARRELALQYVERDAEELIQALGEPLERNYAPSCLGNGEDGELQYEGFTVYTYREGDRETVKDVS